MPDLTQAQIDAINGAARNPYMPTAPGAVSPGSYLANLAGIPPNVTQQLSTPQRAKSQVYSPTSGGIAGQNMPLLAVQTTNGKVGTSRLDGTNVQSFDSWDAFKAYAGQEGLGYIGAPPGEPGALTEDRAISLVRQWTGDQSYNGAKGLTSMDQYKPPTIQAGSPAALGVNAPDPSQWLRTATGSPSNPATNPGSTGGPSNPAQDNKPSEGGPGNAGTTPPAPTTAVATPTQGGIGNFLSPDSAGKTNPATGLGPDASWQTILSSLINAGLIKSQGSNNLIDLATGQLANAQNRTNSIDANQGTIQQFIQSMIQQSNNTQNVSGTPLLRGANWLADQLQAGSQTGSAPGNVQFDPGIGTLVGNTQSQLQPIIQTAMTQAGQSPLASLDPNVTKTINSAITGAQGFVNSYDPANPYANAQGLSPEAKAALRLNQTQVIPGQFNDALSGAYAELQRRGALGGELPGSQEDLMRTLAPIYAARASAYSSANANNILTNAQLQEQQRQQNQSAALQGVGQLTGAAGQQISANQQAINQWLQTQGLGQTAISNQLQTGNLINSQDQIALQNLLSNRSNLTTLIQALGSQGTAANAATSGGIQNLISLINSGTGALQTGNEAVNAATGAYAAGNAPLATATSAGQTAANNAPGSFQNMLLAAILSAGGANAGGIASWLKGILGGGGGNPPISIPPGGLPGDIPGIPGNPPYDPGIPGSPGNKQYVM